MREERRRISELIAATRRAASLLIFSIFPLAWAAYADETRSAPVNLFGTHRFNEDFSYLRDPGRSDDFWDPVKYIPSRNDPDVYMSFGGEVRERYVYQADPNFGFRGLDTDDYLLHRVLLHTDLHLGEHFRAFVQFGSHLQAGKQDAVSPLEENRFDLQQGFVDFSFDLDPSIHATLRVGRQELAFGSQRLVSVRDAPNVRRSFDGFRATLRVSDASIDAFVTRPVAPEHGIFDDENDEAQAFWGAYATLPVEAIPGFNADLYYLGFERDSGTFNQGTAREQRHSIGTRLWGVAGAWDYNVELVGQLGEFGDADIRAWTVASDTGFTFRKLPFQPRLGLHADIASGDGDPNDGTLGTFNALFPKLNYLTEAALVAPANIIDLFPTVTFALTDRLKATVGSDFLWRESKDDAFYTTPLNAVPGTSTSDGRYIGNQFDLELDWQIDRHIRLNAYYVHFFAGETLRDAGGEDVDVVVVQAAYRF
jgi:hypothetical protein